MYPTLVQAHDDELRRRIIISLQSRGVDCLSDAEIHVAGGVVLLSCKFASRYEHHLAMECCRHVAGVLRIEDATNADADFASTFQFADQALA